MHPKDPSSQIQDEINPMHTKSMLGKTYFFKTPFAALRLKKAATIAGVNRSCRLSGVVF